MENKKIFPETFIIGSVEHYTFRLKRSNLIIYQLLATSLIMFIGSSPFILVDISVHTQGIVTSKAAKTTLHAPVSGQVLFSGLEENKEVSRGDTLLILNQSYLQDAISSVKSQINAIRSEVTDLNSLIGWKGGSLELLLPKYQSQFLELRKKIAKSDELSKAFQVIAQRQKKLYKVGAVSLQEYEASQLEWSQNEQKKELIISSQMALWNTEIINLQKQLEQLKNQYTDLTETKSQYTLLAPMSGDLFEVSPYNINQYILQNAILGKISPKGELIAECYVSPTNIGQLRVGQPGNFLIDAFNYNHWGMVTGVVTEISQDVYLDKNGLPYFLVRCSLDKKKLQLKNGFTGNLRKGMTFQANFLVTKRSLFDLAYDTLDDWLNPNYDNPDGKTN